MLDETRLLLGCHRDRDDNTDTIPYHTRPHHRLTTDSEGFIHRFERPQHLHMPLSLAKEALPIGKNY